MVFFETPDQVISAFFIWVFGFILAEQIRRKFLLKFKISHLLYIWHSFFTFIYVYYTINNGGDAIGYYQYALRDDIAFSFGTSAVRYLTSIFVVPLHLSYLGAFFIFNIFGFIGLLAFYASLNQAVNNKPKRIRILAIITVFLPSVSFWSVAIGKDSLALMATGLALWAALKLKRRIWLMIFAIFVMGMIRPHIAGIFIIALSVSFILDKNLPSLRRFLLGILSFIAVTIMIPFALQYVGLDNLNQTIEVIEYVEKRQSYNQQGEGGIDISSMSLPMQLFTYSFRPLPMEAHSITALLASLDNLFLLLLFILFLKGFYKNRKIHHTYNISFMSIFIIFTWIILATTTANLGIAIRQKWMFLPFLIFIFFLYIGNKKTNIDKKKHHSKYKEIK